MADLAARYANGKLVHISTSYVAGCADGEVEESIDPGRAPSGRLFDVHKEISELENDCDKSDAAFTDVTSALARRARIRACVRRAKALGWPNVYTYTKGLAEHLLASRYDLELTIIRPSVVECARNYPFMGWNEGINTHGTYSLAAVFSLLLGVDPAATPF